MKISAVLNYPFFWSLLLLSGSLYAEGNCPPGSYPIGGQGAMGCAPIPAGGQGGPAPTGEWRKTWGAVAMSKVGDGAIGVSSGFVSKSQAKIDALEKCQQLTDKGCKIEVYYKNQCLAIAQPSQGGVVTWGTGPTEARAESEARGGCSSNGKSCGVLFKGCTDPVFRKYK
ncbi:DUF4189 domain-containing protein [Xanthomonas cannabis]|uniref:DUF4189 domain-containing protein n=1 Tax=Xanthomonas cannabis TaxID=1885674 RepID=UPI0033AAF5EE